MLDRETTLHIEKRKEEARKPLAEKFPRLMRVLGVIAVLAVPVVAYVILTRVV
jgi:cytochrome c-type biogenesis protein CcmH/NrfG